MFENPFDSIRTVTSTTILGKLNIDLSPKLGSVRLIQNMPAWSLHALLRFLEIPYTCENVSSLRALDITLPAIVDGNHVLSEKIAKEHLLEKRSSILVQKEEFIWSDYIENSIEPLLHQLKKVTGHDRIEAGTISTYTIESISYLKHALIESTGIKRRDAAFHGLSQEELLKRLDEEYTYLNKLLEQNHGTLFVKAVQRSIADATLFGHLADAQCFDLVAPLIQKQSALKGFFGTILTDYFTDPICRKYTNNWKAATIALVSNRYFNRDIGGESNIHEVVAGFMAHHIHSTEDAGAAEPISTDVKDAGDEWVGSTTGLQRTSYSAVALAPVSAALSFHGSSSSRSSGSDANSTRDYGSTGSSSSGSINSSSGSCDNGKGNGSLSEAVSVGGVLYLTVLAGVMAAYIGSALVGGSAASQPWI